MVLSTFEMFALAHLKPELRLISMVSKIASTPGRPTTAPESHLCSGPAVGTDPRKPCDQDASHNSVEQDAAASFWAAAASF